MPLDATALLKEWGVTVTLLSVAGTACLIIFMISFREFASWFVRINKVIKTQEEILEALQRLEARQFEVNPSSDAVHAIPPLPENSKVTKERFQLHS